MTRGLTTVHATGDTDVPAVASMREIGKRYGDVDALAGITFDIEQDKIYGLLGRNGAGKTTVVTIGLASRAPR